MPKIKDYLTEIEKQIEKQNLTIDEKIIQVKEELKNFDDFYLETEKEKRLKRALTFLEKEKLQEQEKEKEKNKKEIERKILLYFKDIMFEDITNSYNKISKIEHFNNFETIRYMTLSACRQFEYNYQDTEQIYFKAFKEIKRTFQNEYEKEKTRQKYILDLKKKIRIKTIQNVALATFIKRIGTPKIRKRL